MKSLAFRSCLQIAWFSYWNLKLDNFLRSKRKIIQKYYASLLQAHLPQFWKDNWWIIWNKQSNRLIFNPSDILRWTNLKLWSSSPKNMLKRTILSKTLKKIKVSCNNFSYEIKRNKLIIIIMYQRLVHPNQLISS